MRSEWKKRMLVAVVLTVVMLPLLFATGCEEGKQDASLLRIAVAGPDSRMEGEFKNGIAMAVGEINESDYLEGRTVQIEYFDDKRDLTTGIKVAQELAEQSESYAAVIGHWNASINIPAAEIYNDAGLLAISPIVSSPELTVPAKEFIFRTVPTDADEAQKIAAYAAEKGYQNIAVCYTDSDYGIGLCAAFEDAASELGINIIDTHADFINQLEFDTQYKKWTALDVDAIFVSDSLPYATDLINMIRGKSAGLPILSAGGFSLDDVVALAGENSSNIAYVALYYPEKELQSQKEFIRQYTALYGEAPTSFKAFKGYECVKLLADAAKATGSSSSADLAEYLHTMKEWQGVTDTFKFKENGDPEGMELFVVEVSEGSYTYL